MSERVGGGARSWVGWTGWGLTALLLGYTAFVFRGMGPRFEDARWYEPTGWLARAIKDSDLYPLADELRVALVVFGGVALALAIAVFLTTRAATARMLAVFSVLSVASILFYAIEASFVWRFFAWRWSGSLLLLAAIVAAAVTAPLLAASWLRLPRPIAFALYVPLAVLVLVYERNVTGTDPDLRFAISPWPFVQIFGIELLGTCLGALVLGIGVALWIERRARSGGGLALRALAPAVAAGLPTLALYAGSQQNLLPAHAGTAELVAVAALAAATFAAAAFTGLGGDGGRLAARARHWAVGGLLLLAPILAGQLWSRADYVATRDGRARQLIDALAEHYEREGIYPDELVELVDGGPLEHVPEPAIGFAVLRDQEFVYQSFGTSYLLEFSAPRWIQCAYNPPYPEDEDEEDLEEGALDSGSWSCPSKPPELW